MSLINQSAINGANPVAWRISALAVGLCTVVAVQAAGEYSQIAHVSATATATISANADVSIAADAHGDVESYGAFFPKRDRAGHVNQSIAVTGLVTPSHKLTAASLAVGSFTGSALVGTTMGEVDASPISALIRHASGRINGPIGSYYAETLGSGVFGVADANARSPTSVNATATATSYAVDTSALRPGEVAGVFGGVSAVSIHARVLRAGESVYEEDAFALGSITAIAVIGIEDVIVTVTRGPTATATVSVVDCSATPVIPARATDTASASSLWCDALNTKYGAVFALTGSNTAVADTTIRPAHAFASASATDAPLHAQIRWAGSADISGTITASSVDTVRTRFVSTPVAMATAYLVSSGFGENHQGAAFASIDSDNSAAAATYYASGDALGLGGASLAQTVFGDQHYATVADDLSGVSLVATGTAYYYGALAGAAAEVTSFQAVGKYTFLASALGVGTGFTATATGFSNADIHAPECREMVVPFEDRLLVVPFEDRTMQVTCA